jgi:TATA element modulatory factor 1 TATA binding
VALELLGERNERVEQLETDVVEMKSIFREQLSLAADQLAAALEARGTLNSGT